MNKPRIAIPIESRNTAKGNPNAITIFGETLNNRQEKLLSNLRNDGDTIIVKKKEVSMRDLSALTAQEGVEFALFTRKSECMVIRGEQTSVDVSPELASRLNADGWRWSGHTHPGIDRFVLIDSPGDNLILKCFKQDRTVIYNSAGQYFVFRKR